MNEEIVKTEDPLIRIATMANLTRDEVSVIQKTVAKGFTDLELAYFLNVCKSYELSPFKREVYGYKSGANIVIMAGRDGHLVAAQRDKRWSGIASSEVRENDEFKMDIPNGKIVHTYGWKDRGNIVGAYAICKPKGCDIATIEYANFTVYNKGANTWKADPEAMIKKVAETHCLKKAYGLSGLASEYDFTINESTGTAYPLDHENRPTMSQIEYVRGLILTSTFDDDQRERFESGLDVATHSELDQMKAELLMNQQDQIKERGNYSQTDIKRNDRLFND